MCPVVPLEPHRFGFPPAAYAKLTQEDRPRPRDQQRRFPASALLSKVVASIFPAGRRDSVAGRCGTLPLSRQDERSFFVCLPETLLLRNTQTGAAWPCGFEQIERIFSASPRSTLSICPSPPVSPGFPAEVEFCLRPAPTSSVSAKAAKKQILTLLSTALEWRSGQKRLQGLGGLLPGSVALCIGNRHRNKVELLFFLSTSWTIP